MNQPNDQDPILAEVRREREEYAAKFGYDLKLMDRIRSDGRGNCARA
jgi:hypothetical protein